MSEILPLELSLFQGKSDPFVKVKEGSDGKEKFRTRTIDNTLDPVWNETATMAMLDTNGLLLLVKRYSGLIWSWKMKVNSRIQSICYGHRTLLPRF